MKFLLSFLMMIIGFTTMAQLPTLPTGNPNPSSNGYMRYGYVRSDSGWLVPRRDTMWKAIRPAVVYWERAGVDTAFWYYNMSKWQKLNGGSGVGTVTSISLGVGIIGIPDPITTNGDIAADTGRATMQLVTGGTLVKILDSIGNLINLKPNVGDVILNQQAKQTGKRFDIQSGKFDSLYASTATGLILVNNSAAEIGRFGSGSGTTVTWQGLNTFSGGATINGTTTIGSLSGILKASTGVVGAAVSGTDLKTINGTSIIGSGNIVTSITDTSSLSNRINLKLNISDTVGMRSKEVFSFDKNVSRDSAILTLFDGTRIAVKDSIFGGSGDYVPYENATRKVRLTDYGLLTDFVDFDMTPTNADTTGRLNWDSTAGTLAVHLRGNNVHLQIGQEQVILVRNNTGSPLTDGQIVYITGSTGEVPTVALANNKTFAIASRTLGMVTEPIAHGEQGFITITGIVNGLNTNAFTEGSAIWLDSLNGAYTQVQPVSPYNDVLLGYVVKKAGGNGSIFVKAQNILDRNYIDSVVGLRLRIADTTAMLLPYLRDGDTTAMLLPYLRKADTVGMRAKEVLTFAKNAARDSAILTLFDGTRLAVRDSIGGGNTWNVGGNDFSATPTTTAVLNAGGLSTAAGGTNFEIQRNGVPFITMKNGLLFFNVNPTVGTILGNGTRVTISGAGGSGALNIGGATATTTVGAMNYMQLTGNSTYASGVGQHSAFKINYTWNQTGTASAPIVGIDYNPTVTSNVSGLHYGLLVRGGSVGIGTGTPEASALLDITSTTRGFLPPRLTTTERNAITSPAAGLNLYNTTTSTNDVYTSAWYQQPNGLTGSGTLDFPNTLAQTSSDLTLTVTGAAVGDIVILGTPVQGANSTFTAFVSAANTVSVRMNNYSALAIDPASATFKVYVIKN